ncbi:MAG: thioredoxin family protein [Pseudorhodobacter sp.]|nr:thioredoxin family protein [Rhizobacter sp.]
MKFIAAVFAVLISSVLSLAAHAAVLPFEQAAFDKAVAAGEPVIVQFHADGCPACKTQTPLVSQALGTAKLKDVKLFVADFEKEKALKKALKVSSQSTFLVFKAGKEVTRSTGQTSLEAWAVQASPAWLTQLTTRY